MILTHSVHLKVSMKVTVSDVPRYIDNVPRCFCQKPLDDYDITLTSTVLELNSLDPRWFEGLFMQ